MIVKGNFKLKETDIITSRFSSAILKNYIQDVESVSNYYVCGPPKMNISTKSILEDMGIV
jgi:Na+-transporting NADH:ubiquinone oxidoreductase subunit NqrF